MKKFEEYLEESLVAQAKSDPKSAAAKEARKLGLTYMGFGRYADKKGKLAYIVHNDKLVPYKSPDDIEDMYFKSAIARENESVSKKKPMAAKGGKKAPEKPGKAETLRKEADLYNKASRTRRKEDSKILKQLQGDADKVSKELNKLYNPNMFDDAELAALKDYTSHRYAKINRYLYKGHDEDATPDDDEWMADTITAIDSAFEDTQAPFDYTVYSGLSERYSPDKFQPGEQYVFRGYVSSSIDFNTAIGGFAGAGKSRQAVVLQIEIKKGQKSIYVDPLSINSGEKETMLPRGSMIEVVSGPHILDASLFTDSYDIDSIAVFQCQLVE